MSRHWRELFDATIKEAERPHELAVRLYEELGLEPVSTKLSKALGVKPVLTVFQTTAENRSNGGFYFKPLDPLSALEWSENRLEEDGCREGLEQFTSDELGKIHHMFNYVRNRSDQIEGYGRRYVCLAKPEWVDMSEFDLNLYHGDTMRAIMALGASATVKPQIVVDHFEGRGLI